jgi:hypothetical protein
MAPVAVAGDHWQPVPTDDEFWRVMGTLFPEETFHAVRFFRRASGPEGCGRRIAQLGESGNMRGIVPESSRWQAFGYFPSLPAPRVQFRQRLRCHKLAISITRMVV